jgi:hypothetical protein
MVVCRCFARAVAVATPHLDSINALVIKKAQKMGSVRS